MLLVPPDPVQKCDSGNIVSVSAYFGIGIWKPSDKLIVQIRVQVLRKGHVLVGIIKSPGIIPSFRMQKSRNPFFLKHIADGKSGDSHAD